MQVQDDDVIYTAARTPVQAETFRAVDLLTKVLEGFNAAQRALVEGINCRFLSADGGGWKQGKLRLHIEVRLEFTPSDSPPDGRQ
jgi:KGK domain